MGVDQDPGKRAKVGLALGGGGARGLAHIGVLQILDRERIQVDCIAGTSVGSLVGAAYAAGLSGDRLLELALKVRWRDLARPVWPRQGFLSFARMETYIQKIVGDLTFADLGIPYAAVVTDLTTGEPIPLQHGRVIPAVQASCSVPGIATPVEWYDSYLVDGGISKNLPISVARDLGADVVIAVCLIAPPDQPPQGISKITMTVLEHLVFHTGDDPTSADVYLPIPLKGLSSLVRLSAGEKLTALGRQAAEEALPAIRAVLDGNTG